MEVNTIIADNEGKNKPPEWHIFDRIEDLETIALEHMDDAKTAKDAYILTLLTFMTVAVILKKLIGSDILRAGSSLKDDTLAFIKNMGMSNDSINAITPIINDAFKTS